MKPLIQFRKSIALSLIPLALVCFALPQSARAVSPAPDGAYGPPTYGAGNTAEGQSALFDLTNGQYNTANGWNSLYHLSSGSYNTAFGAATLFNNTGTNNTAIGATALFSNTTGNSNTAVGHQALFSNTTGSVDPDTGNTAIGYQALFGNTLVGGNTAIGARALYSNTTGNPNTATGVWALYHNTTGIENTANGAGALYFNTIGSDSTAVGENSLVSNSTGSNNVALGHLAGYNATGSSNVYIGANIQGVAGENQACYIASIFGRTSGDGIPVYINSQNKLGTTTSSARFKQAIKPMDKASEVILALKPVTFRYKKELDPKGIPQFGLVAEDVEKVNPDLVVRDKEGKPYTVRYDQVNAMLLNEFLKEHRTVQQLKSTVATQEAIIAKQKKDFQATIAQLTTRLDEQAAQIQKVSAQLEASKPAPQVVNNP